MPDITLRSQVPEVMADEKEHRRRIAQRANVGLPIDGSYPMTRPLLLKSYTVAGVPTAADWEGGIIYVSNETGGKTVAFSDGTNWRRVQDRAIVS